MDNKLGNQCERRISQLALPKSYLVEAVLKDHYHVFNDKCRDRLKKLLELILKVNRSPSQHLTVEQSRYIKKLRERIKVLETECSEHGASTDQLKSNTPTTATGNELVDFLVQSKEIANDSEESNANTSKEKADIKQCDTKKNDENPENQINVHDVTLRYYTIIIMDVQRNCQLYEEFLHEVMKPTSGDNAKYFAVTYNCWMEYLGYIKSTLLQINPYILNLMKMELNNKNIADEKDKDKLLNDVKTVLPKVLIDSIINMLPWRKLLRETVKCCREIVKENNQRPRRRHRQKMQI